MAREENLCAFQYVSYVIARYNSCGDLSVEDTTPLSLDAYFKVNREFFQSVRYDAGEAGG